MNIYNESLGINMIIPTIIAKIEAISTAPAAISLALPANGLKSGETKSTKVSIAVLTASSIQTKAIANKIQSHSFEER